jgi:hypothetical protein
MTDAQLLMLFDAALRGMLLALLLLLAWVLARDRPRLPAARAALAMMLGLMVQVISSTPQFEEQVPRLWQAPLIAVSVGNAVLFWIFVQALFDDDFRFRPLHAAAWLAVAGLAGFNCVAMTPGSSVLAVTMGLQRGVPLLFSVLARGPSRGAAPAAGLHRRDGRGLHAGDAGGAPGFAAGPALGHDSDGGHRALAGDRGGERLLDAAAGRLRDLPVGARRPITDAARRAGRGPARRSRG